MSMFRDLMFAVLTGALVVAVALVFPGFASPANLAELLDDTAILMLLALGQMLVIVTRGIDLSVAANLALSGMIVALFNRSVPDAGLAAIVAISMASGAALGAFNGVLVWQLRLPPIVVTLGTMSVFRGAIYLLSDGEWVNENEMTREFLAYVRYEVLGLSSVAWLAVLAAVATYVLLRYTDTGRDLFAAGGNPTAAQYAGVDPGKMQFVAYTICGAVAGLCGYLWVARFAVAYTDIALGFELQVIAACLIGGVAIAGGVASVVGVVLGCLFIGVIRNALPLIGISPFWQMFINGVVILVAVLLGARQRARRRTILEAQPT